MRFPPTTPAISRSLATGFVFPLVALGLQWSLWSYLPPLPWLFFYPAVFFSAWTGGLLGGLIATILTSAMAWHIFIHPQLFYPVVDSKYYACISVFIPMGILFSLVHQRLIDARIELRRIHALDLENANRRIELGLKAAKAGMWVWNPVTNEAQWSSGLWDLNGLAPDECGASYPYWEATVHPEDLPKLLAQIKTSVEKGDPLSYEWRLKPDPTCRERWLLLRGEVSRTEQGRVTEYVGIIFDITEQKLAAQELEKMRTLMAEGERIAHFGTWEYIVASREILLSDGERRVYGFDPRLRPLDFRTRLREHMTRGDIDHFYLAFMEALGKGAVFDMTHAYILPDGSERILRDQAQPQFDSLGRLVKYIGVSQDITEQVRAEEQIRLGAERLRLTLDAAEAGIWEWSLANDDNIWSEQLWRLFGLTADQCEPSYEVWLSTLHPDDRDRTEAQLAEAVGQDSEFELQWRVNLPPGEPERWLLSRGRPLFGPEGKPVRYMGIVLDISELKRIEASLRESEQRLLIAQEGAQVGNWELDVREDRVHWSPVSELLYGVAPGSIKNNQDWLKMVHPDDRALIDAQWELIARGQPFEMEFRILHPSGATRWMVSKGRAEYDASGEPIRLYGINQDITERKRAEEERRSLLATLEAALSSMSDAVFISDTEGRFIHFNDAFAIFHRFAGKADCATTLVEYPKFLDVYRTDGALLPLEQWPVPSALRGESGANIEYDFRRRDTGEAWVGSFSYAPIRGEHGGIVGSVVVGRDVTEQKQRERLLRDREARFRAVLEGAREGILLAEETTRRFVDANPAICAMLGYRREELIGLTPADIHPASDLPRIIDIFDRMIRGEIIMGVDIPVLRKDGTVFQSEITASVMEIDGVHYAAGFFRDITIRKRAEAELLAYRNHLEELVEERTHALAERERLLTTVMQVLPVGLWVLDKNGVPSSVNDRARQIWGKETLVGVEPYGEEKAWWPATGERINFVDWGATRALREGQTSLNEVIEIEADDGVRKTLLCSCAPIRDERQSIIGAVVVKQDISELEAARKALRRAMEDAKAAAKSKSAFLANMSHEIRSPMNAVLGYCYLLERLPLPEDTRDLAKRIHGAGNLLMALINDILDFSKIESGKLELESVPFSLHELLENLAAILAESVGTKDLELIIAPAPGVDALIGDGPRLGQILVNLLSNAIKFTEQGLVELRIREESSEGDRLNLNFSVRDTGIGISPEQQGEIFSAFIQGDPSINRRFGGTGLGLTISQQLAQLMGGKLQVASELGQGSEFMFTLPLLRGASKAPGQSHRPPLKVLVAGEMEATREAVDLCAQSLGWRSKQVDSTESALAELRAGFDGASPYDAVLLDCRKSFGDGLAAALRLRNWLDREGLSQAPASIIMLVRAHYRHEVLMQADNRVNGVLFKPVTPTSLHDKVAETLRLSETAGPPEQASTSDRDIARLAGTRVLLVDDSIINLDVARLVLEGQGAVVHQAHDGREAVDWLLANPTAVDVVLMDVQMPIMDGYAATRHIRGNEQLKHLPVLALTAGSFQSLREEALEAGMDDFIPKPFQVDDMIARIQRWTARPMHCDGSAGLQDDGAYREKSALQEAGERMDEPPPIDWAWGAELWGDEAVFRKYLKKFVSQYSQAGDALANYLREGELEQARAMAHKLKGAAGAMHLPRVAELAGRAEGNLLNHEPAHDLAKELQTAIDAVCAAIERRQKTSE